MEKYSQMMPFNHLTYSVSRHSGAYIPEKPSAVALSLGLIIIIYLCYV